MPEFRSALLSDLPALVVIENAAGFNHWSEAQLQESLQKNCVYVAEENREVSGFAVFNSVLDEVELFNIVVLPAHQGKGVGKALLEHGLRIFTLQGLQRCFLEVGSSNINAIALYQYCGFEKIGLRKNYYQRPHGAEDAIIMQLDLRGKLCRN